MEPNFDAYSQLTIGFNEKVGTRAYSAQIVNRYSSLGPNEHLTQNGALTDAEHLWKIMRSI